MNKLFTALSLTALTLGMTACGGGGGGGAGGSGISVSGGSPVPETTFTVNGNTYEKAGSGTKSTQTSAQIETARTATANSTLSAYVNMMEEASGSTLTDDQKLTVLTNMTANLEGNSNIQDAITDGHDVGWTGAGQTIISVDGGYHGDVVEGIALLFAPEAAFIEQDFNDMLQNHVSTTGTGTASDPYVITVDNATLALMNQGTIITSSAGLVKYNNNQHFEFSDATINAINNASQVITLAAQHSNWSDGNDAQKRNTFGDNNDTQCTYGTDGSGMNVANCNTWRVDGVTGDHVIFVGEVDSSDTIPAWSNKAGQGAVDGDYNFIVTESSVGTTGAEGNSFSAPRVAGTAALIQHKFGTDADDTVSIILLTAEDLGTKGVDAIYGHGKLDVGSALSPVGNLN